MHISRIEIRTEESIDIREYTHVRKKEVVVVPLGDRIHTLQRQFCDQVLVPILQRLRQAQAMFDVDPMSLGGYMLLQARGQWRMRRAPTMDRKMSGVVEKNFAVLISLYHAFEVLQKHGISPFHGYLSVLIRQDEKGQAVKGANFRNELIANAGFMEMMRVIETEMKLPTYVGHPKLSRLENTVLTHFLEHDEIEAHVAEGSKRESRVMVFSEFRYALIVDSLCALKSPTQPSLTATLWTRLSRY